jgi:AcrR family transcriptional regulator
MADESRVSRRKRRTLERIRSVAARLFATRGYEGTTTGMVAEQADIAAGTLFCYVDSKAELLLMVYNDRFAEAIAAGVAAGAQATGDPADVVIAMVEPLLRAAGGDPENAAVYQRELIFGAGEETHRAAGMRIVAAFEQALASRILETTGLGDGGDGIRALATAAGRSVFADVHVLLIQPDRVRSALDDDLRELRGQIAMIIAGLVVLATGEDVRAPGARADAADGRVDENART